MEPHRILLVRCLVQNTDGEITDRYIERNHFRMWQYLMANRHGITVQQATVCLWLPRCEFTRQKDIFERAGDVTQVHCLSIGHYDRELGLCTTTQRYIPDADVEKVKKLLLAKLAGDFNSSPDLLTETEAGFAIHREAADELLITNFVNDTNSTQLQH